MLSTNQVVSMKQIPVMARDKIPAAKLPALYLAAKAALKECDRVDEIGEISNKHTALAHYAKQIKDDSLRHYAERIHLRALRRIGELLREIKPGSRLAAASKGGIKRHDATRAINMSFIPEKTLKSAIEAEPPLSKTEVSRIGQGFRRGREVFPRRKTREEISGFRRLRWALAGAIGEISKAGADYRANKEMWPDPAQWAADITSDEASVIRMEMSPLVEWLDEVDRNLNSDKE